MDALSGKATLSKLLCIPYEKGSILKGKKNANSGSKFFPFREDSCQKWFGVQENKQRVTNVVPLYKMVENLQSVSSPLKGKNLTLNP